MKAAIFSLAHHDKWDSEEFEQTKGKVIERYRLSKKQFSEALDLIQKNREMKSIIGIESDLLYLKDDEIIRVAEQWRLLYPSTEGRRSNNESRAVEQRYRALMDWAPIRGSVVEKINEQLSPEALADLETIFYLGCDRIFVEYYEHKTKRTLNKHKKENNPQIAIKDLMDKTNFLESLTTAVNKLGRLSLGQRLMEM